MSAAVASPPAAAAASGVARRVEDNLPLVRHIVGRLLRRLPARYEADELAQWGVCGLLQAARSFDDQQGVTFSTFAYRRIHGAILDELRKADQCTRTERKRMRQIADAQRDIEADRHRSARPEEIAARSAVPLDQVTAILQRRQAGPVPLHEVARETGEDGRSLLDALARSVRADDADGPEAQAMLRERKALLARAMAGLPERERQVLLLYYWKELRVKEIAAVYGVTEGRISQIHTKALKGLARAIRRSEEGGLAA